MKNKNAVTELNPQLDETEKLAINPNSDQEENNEISDSILVTINTKLQDSIKLESKTLKNRKGTISDFDKLLGPTLKKLMSLYSWENEDGYSIMGMENCYLHLENILEHRNKSFRIINQIDNSDKYPIWSYTILNKTGAPQIISEFEIFMINVDKWMGEPESRIINTLTQLNVIVPDKIGRYRFRMDNSVYIANNDAVTIDIRYCSMDKDYEFSESIYPASDRAPFFLSAIFISDENLYTISDFILLDDSTSRNTNQLLDNLRVTEEYESEQSKTH